MKVIVAMSGGVDSSVAALLFKEQGAEVIGVTLRLRAGILEGNDGCISGEDEQHAAEVARQLVIEHVILDHSPDFVDQVLRRSWEEFACGRTPNPCTLCNPRIKFGKLFEYADRIGAEIVATGHYARIEHDNGIARIRRGSDPAKDQTYFLFGLPQSMVFRIRFPIGELKKEAVRKIAFDAGFVNHNKKDSQDTCFIIPGESFQESLRKLFKAPPQTGCFITPEGKTVGRHQGIHQYTIGQRKGLGVAMGAPAYVSRLDRDRNTVTITTSEDDLMAQRFMVSDINWQSGIVPAAPFDAQIQVRYRSQAVSGQVMPSGVANAAIALEKPLRAITPGQAAVFYDQDILLGGGYIQKLEE